MPTTLLIAPYLPVDRRVDAGDWHLIPRAELAQADAASELCFRLAQGLARLYELPGDGAGMGAFVTSGDGRVGDDFPIDGMGPLRRALIFGALSSNQSSLVPEDEQTGNEAFGMLTSDHAQLWAHPFDEAGYTADGRGGMVHILAGGYNALAEDSIRFPYPAALYDPIFSRGPRWDVSRRTLTALLRSDETSRRLRRAIDWLDLAWRNTDAIVSDLRIPALHSGFEALMDQPADAESARRALCALLDPADEPTSSRPGWTSRRSNPIDDEVSDLGWWWAQFAGFRNAILHGDELTADDHSDDRGRAHLYVAEETLRAAIIATLDSDRDRPGG